MDQRADVPAGTGDAAALLETQCEPEERKGGVLNGRL